MNLKHKLDLQLFADELLGTWVFDKINLTNFYPGTETYIENLKFKSNNILFNKIKVYGAISANPAVVGHIIYSGETTTIENNQSWVHENYKTIEIIDTSTLINREKFISWLKTNATKQKAPQTKSKTYTICASIKK